MSVTTEQRREEIVKLIEERGKIKVSEISELYKISEVSVRKDLEYLEAEGHLSRIHGGAVAMNKLYVNMDLSERFKTNSQAKKRLADAVAELIEDNDTVMINAGTTLTYVLHAIKGKRNVSIVTNSIQNATEAALYPSFNVILLGGDLDSKYQFTYGEDALAQLSNYHATKCILSVDGVSVESGLTLYYANEAALVRKMIDSSKTVIVAADSSKIGRAAFAKITDTERVDVLVTGNIDPAEAEKIEKLGVKVVKA